MLRFSLEHLVFCTIPRIKECKKHEYNLALHRHIGLLEVQCCGAGAGIEGAVLWSRSRGCDVEQEPVL